MPIKATIWKLSSLLMSDFNLLVRAQVRDEGVYVPCKHGSDPMLSSDCFQETRHL